MQKMIAIALVGRILDVYMILALQNSEEEITDM